MNRLLFVTSATSGGGAEKSINSVADELASRGWDVVLAPLSGNIGELQNKKFQIGDTHSSCNSRALGIFISIVKMNFLVKKWKPDSIVLNCEVPELVGAFLFTKSKLIVVQHTSIPWKKHRMLGWIVRKLIRFRKATWCGVSDHFQIWPFGITVFSVLPNPLEVELMTKPSPIPTHLIRLLYVGRLSEEKNPKTAVEVAAMLNVELEIVGTGSLLTSLKTIAQELGVRVNFHGYLDNPWTVYKPGDLLIVPSKFEGDGLVILEALKHGIPMIIAGISDFRRFEFPEINYAESTQDYSKKIRDSRNNLQVFQISEGLVKKILHPRDLSRVVIEWESLFQKLS
jgi:glycosyltransferase involved in cell wall biosynthesis